MNICISVAIDGPSGAGKSSVARAAAAKMDFRYVDTGAIYRTIGLAAQKAGIRAKDREAVCALLPEIKMELEYDGSGVQLMRLGGEDVSAAIRMPEISRYASDVSSLSEVRAFLLETQRDIARRYDVIMDGRDIGTVVLPDADVKIYLTASPEERARRRCLELEQKGTPCAFEEVLSEMKLRDHQDMTREVAPLRRAEDAILIDTSNLNYEQSVAAVCGVITEKTGRLCRC